MVLGEKCVENICVNLWRIYTGIVPAYNEGLLLIILA
jgi:hypothetical protein